MRNQEARLRGKIQKVLVMMPNFIFESLDDQPKSKKLTLAGVMVLVVIVISRETICHYNASHFPN